MKVRVRFESSLRDIAKLEETDTDLPEGADVRSLLDKLVEVYGEGIVGGDKEYNWRHAAGCVVVVRNGEVIAEEDYDDTRLADGDVISLVPPIAGGSM